MNVHAAEGRASNRGPVGLPPSTADLLASFPQRFRGDTVRLAEVLDVLGRRSFAGLLLVLAAPQVVPWPLGVSNVLAIPLVAVAAQMALGRRQVWLPRWLLQRPIPRRRLLRASGAMVPLLRRLERLVRPRATAVTGPAGQRLAGLACLVLTLALVVPVPVVSWLTAIALIVLAIGLIESDGIAVLVGVALGALAVALLLVSIFGLVRLGTRLA